MVSRGRFPDRHVNQRTVEYSESTEFFAETCRHFYEEDTEDLSFSPRFRPAKCLGDLYFRASDDSLDTDIQQ